MVCKWVIKRSATAAKLRTISTVCTLTLTTRPHPVILITKPKLWIHLVIHRQDTSMYEIVNSILAVVLFLPFFMQIAAKSIEAKALKWEVPVSDFYIYINNIVFPVNKIVLMFLSRYEPTEMSKTGYTAKTAETQGILYSLLPILVIGINCIKVIEMPYGDYTLSNIINGFSFSALLLISWRVGSSLKIYRE